MVRVLSRIFCWGGGGGGGEVDDEKSFEREKICLGLLGGPGACSPGKFWKYSVQDWLKSHFWTLVTFTDFLKLSSKKIFIWNSFNFFFRKTFFLGGGSFPPRPPVDRTLVVLLLWPSRVWKWSIWLQHTFTKILWHWKRAYIYIMCILENCVDLPFWEVTITEVKTRATFTSYSYRTGLIFGTEKLTVHTGLVRYRTSFGTCSHRYAIVPLHSISRQNKQKKMWHVNKFQTLLNN